MSSTSFSSSAAQIELPVLDRSSSLAIHVQIESWLMEVIAGGHLEAGQRLPNERDLSADLGVSRMTLRQALDALDRRGVITRVTGRNGGAFISEPTIDVDLTGLPGLAHQVERANLRASSEVLVAEAEQSSDTVANALGIDVGSPTFRVERVRMANGSPVAVERSYFPADRLPRFLERDLSGSLYAVLTEYALTPQRAQEYIRPIIADATDALLLRLEVGSPMLLIERTAYASGGLPVEYSRDIYHPERARLGVTSQLDAQERTIGLSAP